MPLRVRIVDRVLIIEIGIGTLKFAAEHCEKFWNGEADLYMLKVTDAERFARDVQIALQVEEEDGSTPISRLLDEMIEDAVEDGSEAIDYDEMERRQRATAEGRSDE
jgi:hypothetical protein